MGGPRLTPEQRRAIVERYSAGEGSTKLGRAFNVSAEGVLAVLQRAGVPRRRGSDPYVRRLAPEEIPKAVRSAFDFGSQRVDDRPDMGHPSTVIRRTCLACGREDWLLAKSVRQSAKAGPVTGLCLTCFRAAGGSQARRYGDKHGSWRGGRHLDPGGYVRVYMPDHPHAHAKRVLEHRLVMEQMLGRYLSPDEQVHHKNGIRDDNRPENLELWTRRQPTGVRLGDVPHCPTCTCAQHGLP